MNLACSRCSGACCETVVLPPLVARLYQRDWLEARGRASPDGSVEIPARCPHLDERGLCDTYDTRPLACQLYQVGGQACRSAVRRRRSPEEAAKILALIDEQGPGL